MVARASTHSVFIGRMPPLSTSTGITTPQAEPPHAPLPLHERIRQRIYNSLPSRRYIVVLGLAILVLVTWALALLGAFVFDARLPDWGYLLLVVLSIGVIIGSVIVLLCCRT